MWPRPWKKPGNWVVSLKWWMKANLGKVALIRDPQGSGFTVYEGDQLTHTRTLNEPGTLIWNELHVSNAAKVIPFYEGIFNLDI